MNKTKIKISSILLLALSILIGFLPALLDIFDPSVNPFNASTPTYSGQIPYLLLLAIGTALFIKSMKMIFHRELIAWLAALVFIAAAFASNFFAGF